MTNHEATDTDTVSRQSVYDTLTEYYHHKTDMQHKALAEALSRVPPSPTSSRPHDISKAKFSCPICGAEMEVTVDEWDEGGAV